MFRPRLIPRTLPAVTLGAGLLLAACGDNPAAPRFEELPTVETTTDATDAKAGRRALGRKPPGEQLAGRRPPGRKSPGEQLAGRKPPGRKAP